MRTVGQNILVLSFALFASAEVLEKCSAPLEYPTTTLDNRFTSIQSFSSGEKVYYKCADDFIRYSGSPYVSCEDGKWSELTLKCEKRTCGNAGDLPNGFFFYENEAYINSKVYARCKKGYVVKGAGFMTCTRSGWSGEFPTCVEGASIPPVKENTCSTPSVANAVQKGGDAAVHQVGGSLSFTCRQGFQLAGAQQITCSPDGQWQPRPPRCLPSPVKTKAPLQRRRAGCGAPEPVKGSHVHLVDRFAAMTEFSSNDRVYYMCDVGYASAGGSKIRRCINGIWTKLSLKCERKSCGHAGEIQNGRFIYTGVEFGDTATAKCYEGFLMIGKATRNCVANGWDGRIPVCEAVVCPEPKVSSALRRDVQAPPYTYRTSIRYKCDVGTIVGPYEIWCTKNGTWSSSPPECREIGCPSPNVANAYWMGAHKKMHEPREIISIECRSGYAMRGPNSISCSKEGNWLPSLPQCISLNGHNWRRG